MNLYEQALAEYNQIKRIAEEQVRQSLNEEMESFISQKFSAKLDEMEMEDSDELDEEFNFNLNEIEGDEEEAEEGDEIEGDEADEEAHEEPDGDEAPADEEAEEGQSDDEKPVSEMTQDEIMQLVRDAVAQALSADTNMDGMADVSDGTDLETGDEHTEADMAGMEDMTGEDEVDELDELDVDELLAEISKEEADEKPKDGKIYESKDKKIKMLEAELKNAKKAYQLMKEAVESVQINNARLFHMNKLFAFYTLTENQKIQIAERFDSAKSIKEAKLIAESLETGLKGKVKEKNKSKVIKESVGSSQRPIASTKPTSKPEQSYEAEIRRVMMQRAGIPLDD